MQYNDEIHGRLTDHSGTLQSNWPNLPRLKPRETRCFYAVDVDNETVATTAILAEAKRLRGAFNGVIRPVTLTDQILTDEGARRRAKIHTGNFQANW